MRFLSWCRRAALAAMVGVAACGSDGGSDNDTNAAPLVSGASEVALFAGSTFSLNGGATDPEGDPLTFTWSIVSQPSGAAAAIASPNATTTEVNGTLPPGDYVFELMVSDGKNRSMVNVNVTLDALTARGSATQGRGAFDVANVDNMLIDRDGGLWFGTDGNYGTNGTADAVYYLDLDTSHTGTVSPTFGQAFRIFGGPSDSEATGPAFNADMTTFFGAIQHPGEGEDSAWPLVRSSATLRGRDDRPLSSVVALAFVTPFGLEGSATPPTNIADYVKAMVDRLNADPAWAVRNGVEFPLTNTSTDSVRAISGLRYSVIARWLDPLTPGGEDPNNRFGANCDYVSYFGDGWSGTPIFDGDGNSGWLWVNHEYISNGNPSVGGAPSGQRLTLALFLEDAGILGFDVTDGTNWDQAAVDTFVEWHKKQLGGTWMRIGQDPVTKRWSLDRTAANVRYDSTSGTRLLVTGPITLENAQTDDDGNALPANVAPGIMGDCSGGTTPWGTIITAEENVQGYYGDLEDWWSSRQVFDPTGGAAAGGTITPSIPSSTAADYGLHSDAAERKDRDAYGFLCEIDVGADPGAAYDSGTGDGHQKLGVMGRVRWENATLVLDQDFQLIPNQPLVIYGANDRRGGRIYKWVSASNYTAGMTKAQIRNLIADGTLYVAHFADLDNAGGYLRNDGQDTLDRTGAAPVRGSGRWIEMSLTSTDIAPNAGASTANNPTVTVLGAGTTVGAALADASHNGIGAFGSQNDLLKMLFTAACKIGVMELNRPEDLEWSPFGYGAHGPLLFIAFTKHGRPNALDANGVLNTDITTGNQIDTSTRPDSVGSIFALKEAGSPAAGGTFEFWAVHQGSNDSTPQ